ADPFPGPSSTSGQRLGMGQPLAGRINRCRSPAGNCIGLVALHGAGGLGALADRGHSADDRNVLPAARLRRNLRSHSSLALGPRVQPSLCHDGDLGEFVPCARAAATFCEARHDSAVVGLGSRACSLRDLPVASPSPVESARGGAPMTTNNKIVFDNVSKFYGEVLGVNRVNLSLPPGVTSLVGPNGSGKTTLMNLMTGLVRPTQGSISVLGLTPDQPEEFFRLVGYCTQFDSFPKGVTGYSFIHQSLLLRGLSNQEARRLALEAIERLGMSDAAGRRV